MTIACKSISRGRTSSRIALALALAFCASQANARGGAHFGGGGFHGGGAFHGGFHGSSMNVGGHYHPYANAHPGPHPNPHPGPHPYPYHPGYRPSPYYPGHYWGAAAGTAIAIGALAYTLPGGCARVVVNGVTYEHCGSTWYSPEYRGSSLVYVVVADPR